MRPAGSHLLYLPSGKYLRALAPGYRELLADAVYLWSIQYYSSYDSGDRYKYLDHIYSNVITELDPHYEDPYLIGALIMAMEAGDLEMALRLLDKGIAANPGDWLLAFEAGFYCYDTLHDYPRAARYFERAMKVPGVHPLVGRLHAEMYNRIGDRRTSWKYWLEIYQSGSDEYTRAVAWRHAHDLKIQIDIEELQSAVKAYAAARGGNPPGLEALVTAGLVDRVPKDAEGTPYLYNRATGQVRTVAHPFLKRSFD
ncbi:MAG: tetratricopeptide repeat protein [Acidobacteria bacterium]|nr:tetratricopeptide repeat protein [Acidobacteriota bacterium]